MKKLGLFIGIDRYTDPRITPLQCAARDARELARQFHRQLGFETTVLTHDELLQGRRVMDELLRMEAKLSAGDMFVLFFAGHGKTLAKQGASSDQLFLLPHASTRILEKGIVAGEGVLSCRMIRAETDGWHGVQRAFIFDACRLPLEESHSRDAGNIARFEGEAVYRGIALGGPHEDDEAYASTPLVILNSCHDEQRAEELNNYGHGLFTGSLLEVLAEYEKTQQSVIINEGLIADLSKRMQKLAREHGKRETTQRPLRLGSPLALSELAAVPDVKVNESVNAQAKTDALLAGLRLQFERQFAARQFTRPLGDNCQTTLEKILNQGQSAPELSLRLQTALDALEKQEQVRRDQQKYDAACAVNTLEAYGDYLKNCELCEHREQAKVAIASLKAETRRTVPEPEPVLSAKSVASLSGKTTTEQVEALVKPDAKVLGLAAGGLIVFGVVLWIVFGWNPQPQPEASPASAPPSEVAASVPSASATPTVIPIPSATPTAAEPAINQSMPDKTNFQDKLANGALAPIMVVLPSGSFQMGSTLQEDEKNGPYVTIAQKFAMAKYEVSNAEYLACVAAQACDPPQWQEAGQYHHENGSDPHYKKLGAALTGAQFPVVGVSWHNAKQYIAWLNKNKQDKLGEYILPSESQWEYAARATSTARWAHGDDEALLEKYACYIKNSKNKTCAVGSFLENKFGLFDMHGNVWEWVEDCYINNYNNMPKNSGVRQDNCYNDKFRVLRGGAWVNDAADARSANRIFGRPAIRYDGIGFRVARTLPSKTAV